MARADTVNRSALLVSELPLRRRETGDRCPACDAPAGTPTLLTSMVRYYQCSRCARSWNVLRAPERSVGTLAMALSSNDHRRSPSRESHPRISSMEHSMSAPQWRWSLIGVWLVLTSIIFVAAGSVAGDRWLLLLVLGIVPPAMLLWLWNEDRPLPIGPLSRRQRP
jgi:hypothetical protein